MVSFLVLISFIAFTGTTSFKCLLGSHNKASVFAMGDLEKPFETDIKINLQAHINEALSFHKNGQVNEAIQKYLVILQYVDGKIAATLHSNLGALYMSSVGNNDQAKFHFTSAAEILPDNAQYQFNLAVLLTSKLNEHRKALKYCKLSLKLDPNNHKVYHLMGNILQSMGQDEEAMQYFTRAEAIVQGINSIAEVNSMPQSFSKPKMQLQQLEMFNNIVEGESRSVEIENHTFKMTCLSRRPMLLYIEDLITSEECEHIISRSKSLLEHSYVMGGKSQSFENSQDAYRSSANAWLSPDTVTKSLHAKISLLTGIPYPYVIQKSEDLQVVKYEEKGQFKVHQDSSKFHPRLLTALFYLNTLNSSSESGLDDDDDAISGGTWFPFANPISNSSSSKIEESDTVEKAVENSLLAMHQYEESKHTNSGSSINQQLPGLVIKPKRGSCIIFLNYDLTSGEIDPLAVHAGLPVHAAVLTSSASSAAVSQTCSQTNSNHDCKKSEEESAIVAAENDPLPPPAAEKWIANYWIQLDPALLSEYLQ